MSEFKVEENKVVSLTYVIMDESGAVLEQYDLPISYVHGNTSSMYPKVAEALEGAKVGDEIEVSLSPAEGFGEHDPSLTFSDLIDNVPPEYRHIGAEATFENEQGESITMTVVKMEDGKIMLDGNHPFAGKTVTFKLRVKEIREATEAEVGSGEVAQQDKPLLH
ncbi:MAG: FKBP-type peptidyl-prolyl cis-trans isomerase [Gammaproteobacteria bacterium]|nr:FKBP-type peptidyl-prolyl cis-trans isomerase [Gammaproteobacteria bacterium]